MDNIEYTLIRRPGNAPASDELPTSAETNPGSAVMAEQGGFANVDACIHQAAEALRIGRSSVSRSFFVQTNSEVEQHGSDPRNLLQVGRQRVLSQMSTPQATPKAIDLTENASTIHELNRQLGNHITKLTDDVIEGRTRPEVFSVQLRATLETYRNSVERLFTRVTITVR